MINTILETRETIQNATLKDVIKKLSNEYTISKIPRVVFDAYTNLLQEIQDSHAPITGKKISELTEKIQVELVVLCLIADYGDRGYSPIPKFTVATHVEILISFLLTNTVDSEDKESQKIIMFLKSLLSKVM